MTLKRLNHFKYDIEGMTFKMIRYIKRMVLMNYLHKGNKLYYNNVYDDRTI